MLVDADAPRRHVVCTAAAPALVWLLCLLLLAPAAVSAQAGDPAVAPVQTLTAALLKAMKAGRAQSSEDRYRSLAPVIEQSFDLPLMAKVAVGPDWARFSPEQQKEATVAFRRFTVASYTSNFNEFSGQRFEIEPAAVPRDQDRIVRTRIISTDGTTNSLLYRMRNEGGSWKIVDVIANGVSELVQRRTDFVALVASGGPPALIAHLQRSSDNLMR